MKSKKILFNKESTAFYRLTGPTSIAANQSIQAIKSVILATEIIQKTILENENSDRVRNSLIHLYSRIFCSSYNKSNAGVLRRIEYNIKELGGKLEYNGNKKVELLSKIIGIKKALIIKHNLKKLIKKLM